jgi:glyoxylase-like metal-dependent hydrolase (beta-lactamase superfamily II)
MSFASSVSPPSARGVGSSLPVDATECDNTVSQQAGQFWPASQLLNVALALWRRCLVLLGGLLLTLLVAGCGSRPVTASGDVGSAALVARAERSVQLAPGVYMVQGLPGEVDGVNLGRVGNTGFIVGPTGVVVIDSGTSAAQGEALLAEVARVTDQPVKLLLLTHTRQEFIFGAMAFHRRGIPIHMHPAAAALMASRCENCLKTLKRLLGDEVMAGTEVPKVDVMFDADQQIDVIGRPLRVLEFGLSSGPGHVVVIDQQTGVMFAGGLLDAGRIPDVQDSLLTGWNRALDRLRTLVADGSVRRIVPGHGPVSDTGLIDVVARYLAAIDRRTLELLDAGAALSEVGDASEVAEFAGWDQYDTIHRRNASVLFLRHERERMLQ